MTLVWLLLLLLLHAASARKLTEEENEQLKRTCGPVKSPEDFSSTSVRSRAPAEVSEYPFVVALTETTVLGEWMGETQYRHSRPFCSGVLISPRHILTAAHCICRNSSKYVQGVWELCIPRRAKEEIGVNLESVKRPLESSSIIVHPSYGPTGPCPQYCDIAVIELNEDVNVDPVCMPEVDSVILGPYSMESIGYGNVEMQSVRYQAFHEYVGHRIIAVYSNTSSVVKGDSGGPLVQNLDGRHYLFGILSCDVRRTIADPYAGMQTFRRKVGANFMDVRLYLDWICEETGKRIYKHQQLPTPYSNGRSHKVCAMLVRVCPLPGHKRHQ